MSSSSSHTLCVSADQGEANQGDPRDSVDSNGLPMASYGCRFPAMIADWRKKWAVGSLGTTADDFPFDFVQLAPWFGNTAPACDYSFQFANCVHIVAFNCLPLLELSLTNLFRAGIRWGADGWLWACPEPRNAKHVPGDCSSTIQ